MKENFKNYLIACGYSQTTPNGNPSTVYAYCKSIDMVTQEEKINWNQLADQIDTILPCYDDGGIKQSLGKKSHCTVINALRRFSEFVKKGY